MRKLIIVIIFLVVIVSLFSINLQAATPYKFYFRGDANGDLKVNVVDMVYVELAYLGKRPITRGMDANGDGTVDVADSIKMERYILGLSHIPGDVDRNCTLDNNDVVALERYLLGLKDHIEKNLAMDANLDGVVNMGDVAVIENMIYYKGK